ncbi:DUF3219 family protein [Alkalibacillus aidingensis]|uniref:DUF3219 family protein n=1 Tax=Alkalibacillus aidingensis TaxID=2747607 RepID=UPI00166067D9|nr:DUF3219 family protein [Alkalibacillus aidingensis]
MTKILVNDYPIEVDKMTSKQMEHNSSAKRLVQLEFKVKHEDYHDITTLLYKNDFDITIPEENLQFQATIQNYTTSFTNLYEKGSVGDFYLELIEKS